MKFLYQWHLSWVLLSSILSIYGSSISNIAVEGSDDGSGKEISSGSSPSPALTPDFLIKENEPFKQNKNTIKPTHETKDVKRVHTNILESQENRKEGREISTVNIRNTSENLKEVTETPDEGHSTMSNRFGEPKKNDTKKPKHLFRSRPMKEANETKAEADAILKYNDDYAKNTVPSWKHIEHLGSPVKLDKAEDSDGINRGSISKEKTFHPRTTTTVIRASPSFKSKISSYQTRISPSAELVTYSNLYSHASSGKSEYGTTYRSHDSSEPGSTSSIHQMSIPPTATAWALSTLKAPLSSSRSPTTGVKSFVQWSTRLKNSTSSEGSSERGQSSSTKSSDTESDSNYLTATVIGLQNAVEEESQMKASESSTMPSESIKLSTVENNETVRDRNNRESGNNKTFSEVESLVTGGRTVSLSSLSSEPELAETSTSKHTGIGNTASSTLSILLNEEIVPTKDEIEFTEEGEISGAKFTPEASHNRSTFNVLVHDQSKNTIIEKISSEQFLNSSLHHETVSTPIYDKNLFNSSKVSEDIGKSSETLVKLQNFTQPYFDVDNIINIFDKTKSNSSYLHGASSSSKTSMYYPEETLNSTSSVTSGYSVSSSPSKPESYFGVSSSSTIEQTQKTENNSVEDTSAFDSTGTITNSRMNNSVELGISSHDLLNTTLEDVTQTSFSHSISESNQTSNDIRADQTLFKEGYQEKNEESKREGISTDRTNITISSTNDTPSTSVISENKEERISVTSSMSKDEEENTSFPSMSTTKSDDLKNVSSPTASESIYSSSPGTNDESLQGQVSPTSTTEKGSSLSGKASDIASGSENSKTEDSEGLKTEDFMNTTESLSNTETVTRVTQTNTNASVDANTIPSTTTHSYRETSSISVGHDFSSSSESPVEKEGSTATNSSMSEHNASMQMSKSSVSSFSTDSSTSSGTNVDSTLSTIGFENSFGTTKLNSVTETVKLQETTENTDKKTTSNINGTYKGLEPLLKTELVSTVTNPTTVHSLDENGSLKEKDDIRMRILHNSTMTEPDPDETEMYDESNNTDTNLKDFDSNETDDNSEDKNSDRFLVPSQGKNSSSNPYHVSTRKGAKESNVSYSTPKISTSKPTGEEEDTFTTSFDQTTTEMYDPNFNPEITSYIKISVQGTEKDVCFSQEKVKESISRIFDSKDMRSTNQVVILNRGDEECGRLPSSELKNVSIKLYLTDSLGQYNQALTNKFFTLYREKKAFNFPFPVTGIEKISTDEMKVEDSLGSGTMIAAIVISSIAGLCLLSLTILLVVMRKRHKGFSYGQRCTPVSLEDYSLDNISVYNSVRRKPVRASKRSYGNPAFDDSGTVSNNLNFASLINFSSDRVKVNDEFAQIPVVLVKPDELPAGVENKNRYANVIPLPETRVQIRQKQGVGAVDHYINANYVKGTKGAEKFYIACQAPLQDTITDFWLMIWEQQSRMIIMLTDLYENGVEKSADYLPPSEVVDCHRVFGDLQVTLKKREVREKYIISSLQLKHLGTNLWREVTHMWYVSWPHQGVPTETSAIIAFLIEARSYIKSKEVDSPIVVHCSPGTGRTGTVIVIDICIRDFETNRAVDIPQTVYSVRRDRAGSVQTKDQYAFIYQVLQFYATKLTGGGLDSI